MWQSILKKIKERVYYAHCLGELLSLKNNGLHIKLPLNSLAIKLKKKKRNRSGFELYNLNSPLVLSKMGTQNKSNSYFSCHQQN